MTLCSRVAHAQKPQSCQAGPAISNSSSAHRPEVFCYWFPAPLTCLVSFLQSISSSKILYSMIFSAVPFSKPFFNKVFCLHVVQSASACRIENSVNSTFWRSKTAKLLLWKWLPLRTLPSLRTFGLGFSTSCVFLRCRAETKWTSLRTFLLKFLTDSDQSIILIPFPALKILALRPIR